MLCLWVVHFSHFYLLLRTFIRWYEIGALSFLYVFFFHHLMMIPSKWSKCLKSLFFSVWFIFGFSPTAPSWWKDGRISRRRLCKLIQIFIYMHILRIHAHTLMLNIFYNLFGFNSIYFESLQVIKTVKLQNLFAKSMNRMVLPSISKSYVDSNFPIWTSYEYFF